MPGVSPVSQTSDFLATAETSLFPLLIGSSNSLGRSVGNLYYSNISAVGPGFSSSFSIAALLLPYFSESTFLISPLGLGHMMHR